MDQETLNRVGYVGLFISGAVGSWDRLSHKSMLAIAGAIIAVLTYWGFTRTFDQLNRLELGQTNISLQMHDIALKAVTENAKQDVCIGELKTKQDIVIQTLKEMHPNKN